MSVNFKELFDKAFKLHNEGNLSEAEKLYNVLIEMVPEDFNVLNLYGLLCLAKKENQKAVDLLSRAVVLSKSSYVICNLGKAHVACGNTENAIKLFEQSIEKDPSNDDAYYSMAIAYKRLKNLEAAAQCYEKAISINPKNYNAGYNLIVIYRDLKKYKEAIKHANRCILIKPNTDEVYSILSFLYECTGDLKSAIKALEKAAKINEKQYLYYFNLAVLYSKIKDVTNSIINYEKVLTYKPDSTPALVNLSLLYRKRNINRSLEYILEARKYTPKAKNVLLNLAQIYKDMSKNDESIDVLNELIEIQPKSHEAFSILAMNYMDTGKYVTALEFYNKAVELSPENPSYLHGKAVALKYLGKTDEFKDIMQKVIQMDPDTTEVKITLGMAYLAEKDFEKGMELYRSRNLSTNFNHIFSNKVWKPFQDLSKKKVVLYSNCGLGDTIMYARYFSYVYAKAKKVIVQTDEPLVSLLQSNFPNIEVLNKKNVIDKGFDVAIPVMDIPYALRMDFSDIPFSCGYIKPDDKLVVKCSTLKEFNTEKKKVGLFLQGNKKIFKNRFLTLNQVLPFFENENIQFYSIQVGQQYEGSKNIIDLSLYIKSYAHTAALLSNMDLIVSIDTSIAHIAGAMGLKTFLMLPYTAEWRWFDDKETTPWYDSIKIFKQTTSGDWSSVVSDINNQLKML